MGPFPQKLAAEFLGTFTWIFLGAGAVCATRLSADGNPGLLGVALAQGIAVAVMVTALGHISGGHFNPAVTIGFWVSRKMGTLEGLAYWVAQLLGATAAAYLLTLLFPEDVWRAARLGTPALAADLPVIYGILTEAVLTFILVVVVFGAAADPKSGAKKLAGLAIGLTVAGDILVGASLTGAAMNPARAFGPALAAKAWAHHGVYWVGPLLGGALAGWLYSLLFREKGQEA
jgi:MIP family channel proteins